MKHRVSLFVLGCLLGMIAGYRGDSGYGGHDVYASEDQMMSKIRVMVNGKTTIFALNKSSAAKDLLAQLPLDIAVENYSNNEKIFYPPKKLQTTNTPKADAQAGTLTYYAPWGNVVMFYGKFGSAAGLYELGHALAGSEYIQGMSGTIQITRDVD